MKKNVSTNEVKKMYDLCRQYDVFKPWLTENGYAIEDLPLAAENEDGEAVILQIAGTDERGDPIFEMTTAQSNGWLRINYYYRDGTVEETYKR